MKDVIMLSTLGFDIPVYRATKILPTVKIWHSCSQSELTFSNLPKTWKTLCFLSAIRVDNHSFQNYLEKSRRYASRQLSELTTVAFGATLKKENIISSFSSSKLPLLVLLLWVTKSLLKIPGLKSFKPAATKLWCPILCSIFR